jgi:hypothetical protein
MASINIKVQSLCTSSSVKLIFSLSILLMTKSFAQVPQQLGINLFEQYDSPQALFEAFGKDINTDKIDVDFDLTGTGFKTTDNYDGSLTEIPEYMPGVPKLEQWNEFVELNGNINNKVRIEGLRLLNNKILVGYVKGMFWEPDQAINEKVGFTYGFGAKNYGSLSELNYDIKIDWGGHFSDVVIDPAVYWNPIFLGMYPWPHSFGIQIPGVPEDAPYNTYRQTVSETTNGKVLNSIEKIYPPKPSFLFNLPKWATATGAIGYPMGPGIPPSKYKFIIEIRTVTGDPLTGKFGIKASVNPNIAKGGFFSKQGAGMLGELEVLTKPTFKINSVGFGGSFLRYPIPPVPIMHLQELFGGLYNMNQDWFYVKAESLISVFNNDVPFLGWLPAYGKATAVIKANGYLEAKGNFYLLGFSVADALMYLDFHNKKFHQEFNNMPVAPMFLSDGKTTISPSGFSMSSKSHLSIPRSIPVIGGLTLGGVTTGIDARSNGSTDIYANAGLQIAKFIPRICSPIKVTWNVRQQFCTWRSCCWRWWWGACGSGCPKCNWGWLPKFEWKTVCTDPIPAKFGQFRVGVKFNNGKVDPYYKPLSARTIPEDFFAQNYLKDYPEWENPFYSYNKDEAGRIAYYNYNWDIIYKVYSTPQSAFQPSVEVVEQDGSFNFVLEKDKYEHVVVRLNYEKILGEASNVILRTPTGEGLGGVSDNLPFGYTNISNLITCSHKPETNEIFYYLVDPSEGQYSLELLQPDLLGEYTVEVMNQNDMPELSYGMVENAVNRDGEVSDTQLDVLMEIADTDTDGDSVFIALHLDRNKQDFDGLFVDSRTLADLKDEGSFRFDTNHLGLNPGMYYAYVLIDDQRNTPIRKYLDGRIFIQDDLSPDPVDNFAVAPIDNGFELSFTINQEYLDDPEISYEVMILDEDNPDDLRNTIRLDKNQRIHRISGLVNGNSYLVSPIAVDGENKTSAALNYKRVVPGLGGYRHLDILPISKKQATVGYNFNALIKFRDGDILNSFDSDYNSYPDILFKIIGDNKGAEVSSKGIFSWIPQDTQVGDNKFQISIERIETIDKNNPNEFRIVQTNLVDLSIEVFPATNLIPLTKNGFQFMTMPVELADPEVIYEYKPEVTSTAELGHSYMLIEGPDGMVFDQESKTLLWDSSDAEFGSFVELALIDNDSNKITAQRWFIDVVRKNKFVNHESRINGFRREINEEGVEILKVVWDAPESSFFNIQASGNTIDEWITLNEEPIIGGIGNSFELPLENENISGAFIRIVPQN